MHLAERGRASRQDVARFSERCGHEEIAMNDCKPTVPASRSFMDVAHFGHFQSRAPATSARPLESDRIADFEWAGRRTSEQLREANEELAQSEERFRDLFEEAPIAYVREGLDSRFIQANRAAMRI